MPKIASGLASVALCAACAACSSGDPATTPPGGGGAAVGGSGGEAGGAGGSGAIAGAGGGTGGAPVPWAWDLPPGFPIPVVPEDNPMTTAKVELGRHLFYDERLSGNETQSCSSCHVQSLAFTDGAAFSLGSTGEPTPRSSMSLANTAYAAVFTWANPVLFELETQAAVPLFGTAPIELGLAGIEDEILARFAADPEYVARFEAAFPDEAEPITMSGVVRALASFQRTLLSARSPYDRYAFGGEEDALSDSAKRGLELFNGHPFECFHCHAGFNFQDSVKYEGKAFIQTPFHNTGLYNVGGTGAYPAPNTGLHAFTGQAADMGKFRAPTLRNIAITAPYMHDGSIATLSEVLDHYAAGGRTIASGPNAGVGADNPFKSNLVPGFALSELDRADLIAFLESLTDETLLRDPDLADPDSD